MRHDDLLQQIKVASLLGDHVYISAGHVYENPYTLKLLEAEPDLLNTGIVAIGLREECRDFSDLEELRRVEARPSRMLDQAATTLLNRECSAVIRWHPSKMQAVFKQAVLAELMDSNSVLRRRLTAVRRQWHQLKQPYADWAWACRGEGGRASCAVAW